MRFKALALLALALLLALLPSCAVREIEPPEPLPRPRRQLFTTWLPRVQKYPSKGIGLTYGHCGDALLVGASWFYQWNPWPTDCPGVESVPMIWGERDIGKTPRGTSIWLLGFNEPDRWNQADLTPCEAAELWREVELLYGDDWLLVSPAVSHTDLDWLREFYWAYVHRFGRIYGPQLHRFVRKPVLDALAVHCYANDVDECIETVQAVIAMADDWQVLGGVWVTEFAFWPVEGEEVSIALGKAREFLEWLGGESRVARYAWFAARIQGDEWWAASVSAPLVEFDGAELTVYGVMYANP